MKYMQYEFHLIKNHKSCASSKADFKFVSIEPGMILIIKACAALVERTKCNTLYLNYATAAGAFMNTHTFEHP